MSHQAFNDVAEHDVVWGASNIEYGQDVALPGIQALIPLGIVKLREIMKAKTYDERYKTLDPYRTSRRRWPRMAEALRESYIHPSQCPADGSYPPPLVDDKDSGPRMIWDWAHWEEEQPDWTYQAHRDGLRRWGYVLWDKARLEEAMFYQLWEDREDPEEALARGKEELRQRRRMERSWEERKRVLFAGGSGWWSRHDESRIQWRGRGKTKESTLCPTEGGRQLLVPDSIEEAREMLTLLELPSSVGEAEGEATPPWI